MARTSVKATYALDVASVQALEKMARRWDVSKSEALRRAIHAAAAGESHDRRRVIDTLDRVQRALALTPTKATTWVGRVQSERARTPRVGRPKRR
jgi:hypothetical protein